jgi:hypothetical protein
MRRMIFPVLYALPLIAWFIFVMSLKPKNVDEFIFIGHWLLIPVFWAYFLWIPILNWMKKRQKKKIRYAE